MQVVVYICLSLSKPLSDYELRVEGRLIKLKLKGDGDCLGEDIFCLKGMICRSSIFRLSRSL